MKMFRNGFCFKFPETQPFPRSFVIVKSLDKFVEAEVDKCFPRKVGIIFGK